MRRAARNAAVLTAVHGSAVWLLYGEPWRVLLVAGCCVATAGLHEVSEGVARRAEADPC